MKLLLLLAIVAFVFGRGGRLGDLVRAMRALPAQFNEARRRGRDPEGAAKAVRGRVVDDDGDGDGGD